MHRIPLELRPDAVETRSPLGYRPARRSLVVVALLALGFVVSREFPATPPYLWFAASGFVAIGAIFSSKWTSRVLLSLAVFVFATGWFAWRIHTPCRVISQELQSITGSSHSSSDHTARLEPTLVTAKGVVLDTPRQNPPSKGALASYFRVSSAATFSMRSTSLAGPAGVTTTPWNIRVTVSGDEGRKLIDRLRAGDFIELSGHLHANGPPLNPSDPDRRLLGAQRGEIGRLRVPESSLIKPTEPPIGSARFTAWLARAIDSARSRTRTSLYAIIGEQSADTQPSDNITQHPSAGRALLAAMLLGEREPGYDEADQAFRRLGLVHLVAISGFNLAILAGLALFLVRLTGDRGRLEPLIAALVVSLYMVVVPAEAPILRAGITLLVFLLTEAAGARFDRLTLLGWTATGLLLWRPMDLWSLGFQLSFGIVAVLLWLGDRTSGRLFGVELRGVADPRRTGTRAVLIDTLSFFGIHARTLVATSLLAWCVALPIIAHHTGVVSPLAVLSTIIVLPLTVLVLWAGYIALLIGVISPEAGSLASDFLRSLGDTLATVVMRLDDVPGMSVTMPHLSAAWALVATACVLAWFRWWRGRDRAALIATALAAAWFAVELSATSRLPSNTSLRIDTLAVGDATCHLIRSGDDALLWDAGSANPNFGAVSLPRVLRELNVHSVHTVVITHANLDHFGSLIDAAPRLGVRRVLVGAPFLRAAADQPDSAHARVVSSLRSLGVTLEPVGEHDAIAFGSTQLRFLSPSKQTSTFESVNDTSLVGLFSLDSTTGPKNLVMTGDLGPFGLRALRDRYPDLHADVLEVPHHGSFNHESSAFVQAINPRVVIQSTGRLRTNDPRWEPARHGRTWLCTSVDGAITTLITADGDIRTRTFVGDAP